MTVVITNINVCLLPPNTTGRQQPLDNKPVKQFDKKKLQEWYAKQVVQQFSGEDVSFMKELG